MKRMFVLGMVFALLLGCLCGCGKNPTGTGATQVTLQDVAIEGGLESATKAVEVYSQLCLLKITMICSSPLLL